MSRDRVLQAAVACADAEGIDALTMRPLADALGTKAMSLYYHDLIHHSLPVLGRRALDFSQELFEPDAAPASGLPELPEAMAAQFPHLAGMMAEVVHDVPDTSLGWCDDQFEFSLDLILDGPERLRRGAAAGKPREATAEPGL